MARNHNLNVFITEYHTGSMSIAALLYGLANWRYESRGERDYSVPRYHDLYVPGSWDDVEQAFSDNILNVKHYGVLRMMMEEAGNDV